MVVAKPFAVKVSKSFQPLDKRPEVIYTSSTMVHFSLDKKSPAPFYRQIVDLVLAGISSGAISPGDKLPTIREMAVKLEINPNTVVRAYSQLQTLGVLDTQQGSGVFVGARPSPPRSATEKKRAIDALCLDFVGRAQLMDISVKELIERLRRMQHAAGPRAKEGETDGRV